MFGIGVSVLAVAVVGNRSAGPDHRLGRDLIGKSEPRAEAVLPHVLQDVAAAASRPGAGEFERAQDSARCRVGNRRIEIAVLAMLLESGEGQVVAQSDVERQLVVDLDVVLVIPREVAEDEVDIRAETEVGAVGQSQQEGRVVDAGVGYGRVGGGGVAGSNYAHATVAVDAAVIDPHEFEAELHAVPALQPRHLVVEAGGAAGRNGVDVAAEIAEFGLVLAVVGRFVGGHAGDQSGLAIRIVQRQVRTFSQVALVVAEAKVIQHVRLDDVVGIQAVVLGIAEFLEGFGERSGDRPDQLIAVEVLAAEEPVQAKLRAHVVVALDGVNALVFTGRPASIDSGVSVLEHDVRIVG